MTQFKIGDTVYFLQYGRATRGEVIGFTHTKYDLRDFRLASNVYVGEGIKNALGVRRETYAIYCMDNNIAYLEYTELFSSKENLVRHILGEF
jgi:hypothetical protein